MLSDGVNSTRKMMFLWEILLIISIITTAITIVHNKSENLVGNLFMLPFSYAISLLITRKAFQKQFGLALAIIEVVLVCRFIILPILFAYDNNYTGVSVYGADYEMAVWLIVYELLAVSIAMWVWVSIQHKVRMQKKVEFNNIFRYTSIFVIVFWFFIVATNEKLRGNLLNFGLSTREKLGFTEYITVQEYQKDVPGVYRVFFNIGLIVLLTSLVRFVAKRNWYKGVKAVALLAICVAFISSMWTNGFSVSRWGMLVATIISIFVLMYSFPSRKKAIIIFGIFGVVSVILIGSLLKTFSFGAVDYTLADSSSKYFNAEYFDEYFSGIAPVANGIRVAAVYTNSRGVEGIFLDTFYNFPYAMQIMGLSDGDVATNYFHALTDHADLIMPNITISLLQFGWIFAPAYSVLLVILALWFDLKQKFASSLYNQLFYTVLVFWTSLFMALNVNIVDANIWYAIIGLTVIHIEEKIRISKKKY